jgi:pimeloyl-ACP methyl ester carboxylesterase
MLSVSSVFKTPMGKADYLAAYDAALALWPVPYESLFVPTRFGATHLVASGPQDAPPLLLLHGLGTSATMWYPNVGELSRHFRTYAVDIVGQPGKSEVRRPLRSREDCAQWLLDVFCALGIVRARLVGLSLGGWLALNFALAAPDRIEQLVLLSPVGGIVPFRRLVVTKMMCAALFPIHSHLTRLVIQPFFGERVVLNDCFARQCLLGVEHFGGWMNVPIPTVFPDDALRRLDAPTLLLVGEHEIFYEPQKALKRARRLLPYLEAEMLPHAGHALSIEQPHIVNERMLQFLLSREENRYRLGAEHAPADLARLRFIRWLVVKGKLTDQLARDASPEDSHT